MATFKTLETRTVDFSKVQLLEGTRHDGRKVYEVVFIRGGFESVEGRFRSLEMATAKYDLLVEDVILGWVP